MMNCTSAEEIFTIKNPGKLVQGKTEGRKNTYTADIVVTQSWLLIGETFLQECSLTASYGHGQVGPSGGQTSACDWWRALPVASSRAKLLETN